MVERGEGAGGESSVGAWMPGFPPAQERQRPSCSPGSATQASSPCPPPLPHLQPFSSQSPLGRLTQACSPRACLSTCMSGRRCAYMRRASVVHAQAEPQQQGQDTRVAGMHGAHARGEGRRPAHPSIQESQVSRTQPGSSHPPHDNYTGMPTALELCLCVLDTWAGGVCVPDA